MKIVFWGTPEYSVKSLEFINNSNHQSNMSHFKVFGDNTIGVEDRFGNFDNDFDDLILHLSIDNVI